MKINVCSETELLGMHGEGVSTSFLNCVELLKEGHDIEVLINGEGRGDVMHSHTYGPYFFLRGRRYKGRRILTVHVTPDSFKGSVPADRLIMPIVRWYFKKVFSYADICIAISPMVEKTIRDLGAKTRSVALSNPILLEQWERTRELREKGRLMLGLEENEFCVLGVGQLEGRKGCEDFIDIGAQVRDARFRWVGGRPFGVLTEGIRKLNRKIEAATENVRFSGMFPLNEMPAVYAAADLFLFPSYQENCPLAPLEAAASGIPVIYRDLEEYKLLYSHEYLKAATLGDFVDWTKKIMNDKAEYGRGLEISSQLILQFDKKEIRKRLIEIYSGLCGPAC